MLGHMAENFIRGDIHTVWERLRSADVFINHEEVIEYRITNVGPLNMIFIYRLQSIGKYRRGRV